MTAISNNDIARAIYLAGKGKSGGEMHQIHKNVINFLAKKRLMSKSTIILTSLGKIINSEEGIMPATVSSAKRLHSEDEKTLVHFLKKRYSAKEVTLTKILDEKLLGGFKVEANNEVIDLTIKTKLGQLQEYLTRPAH